MVETWPARYDAEGRLHSPYTEATGVTAYRYCCSCLQLWPCPTARRLPDDVVVRLAQHYRPREGEARGG